MQENYRNIYRVIKRQLANHRERCKFVIYPFGELGAMTKGILNGVFGIQEAFIIDQNLIDIEKKIYPLEYLRNIDCSKYRFIVASSSEVYYDELRNDLHRYVQPEYIIDIFPRTKCGKYSYGPLCNHWLVKSAGAFSSFAAGTDAVPNHAMQYISTHPFMYTEDYETYCGERYYFPGVIPKGIIHKDLSQAQGGG